MFDAATLEADYGFAKKYWVDGKLNMEKLPVNDYTDSSENTVESDKAVTNYSEHDSNFWYTHPSPQNNSVDDNDVDIMEE